MKELEKRFNLLEKELKEKGYECFDESNVNRLDGLDIIDFRYINENGELADISIKGSLVEDLENEENLFGFKKIYTMNISYLN